jgi:hypothetical protein
MYEFHTHDSKDIEVCVYFLIVLVALEHLQHASLPPGGLYSICASGPITHAIESSASFVQKSETVSTICVATHSDARLIGIYSNLMHANVDK